MARKIDFTLKLTGELLATTPLHVGGAGEDAAVDQALAQNGAGHYYLPGTSLAGALRHWATAGQESLDANLWGSADEQGAASCILVDDAEQLDAETSAPPELWHGVGLDRYTGAAADKIKFDRQILPQCSRFGFCLQIEAQQQNLAQARSLMGRLINALEAGHIGLGAGTGRGLGGIKLEHAQAREIDWCSRAGVLAYLRQDEAADSASDLLQAWRSADPAGTTGTTGAPVIHIEVLWQAEGPLMSKSAHEGLGVNGLPFLSAVANQEYAMVLPGSGIKGALRSQAERIVRTVLGQNLPPPAGDNHQHMDQLNLPLIKEVFGCAAQGGGQGTTAAPGGRRARLKVATCYAQSQRRPAQAWADLALTVDTKSAPNASSQVWASAGDSFQRAFHVAVDRWTGGAAEHLLYSAVEPMQTQWQPLRWDLDLEAGSSPETGSAAFALVWLLLRDLAQGRLPLGYGVNRGYGALKVQALRLTGVPGCREAVHVTDLSQLPSGPFQTWLSACSTAWKTWLAQQSTPAAPQTGDLA